MSQKKKTDVDRKMPLEETFITSNVVTEADTRRQIGDTLTFVSKALAKTLGPYGSTTIVHDREAMAHFMTKDGYKVLNSIQIMEEVPRTVLNIITRVSRTLVRTVGDGSTSSIVVSNNLYHRIAKLLQKYSIAPKDMVDALTLASQMLADLIDKKAYQIPDLDTEEGLELVACVAAVSTNNDLASGDLVAKIFQEIGRHGFVTIDDNFSETDEYKITNGLEHNRGWIDSVFINDHNRRSVEFENAFVLLVDDFMTQNDLQVLAEMMTEIVVNNRSPMVIVARGFDDATTKFFRDNKVSSPTLPICVVDIAMSSKDHLERFEDIAAFIGGRPLRKSQGEKLSEISPEELGIVKAFSSDELKTRFVGGRGVATAKLNERVEKLKEKIQELSGVSDRVNRDAEIRLVEKRIAALTSGMAVLRVGGATDSERSARKDLFEDAVYAVQSALRHGIVMGGTLAVPHIIASTPTIYGDFANLVREREMLPTVEKLNDFSKDFLECILKSFKMSFRQVLLNSGMKENVADDNVNRCVTGGVIYNLSTREFEPWEETSIVNSADTEKEIMKAAFSIISLLATSNQFLASRPGTL
jgi:chaperonin GroEL